MVQGDLPKYGLLIDNHCEEAVGGAWLESINPYTAQPWALIPRGDERDVARATAAAKQAFNGTWRSMPASGRAALLRRLADLVEQHAELLAELETRDNGKLISETRAQLRYIPQWFHFYAGLADKINGKVIPIDKPGVFNYTLHEPLGVIAVIPAWNSPLMLAVWKLAPALAAGNTIVWKPSEHASVSSLEFCKLFAQAGFPPGVVNIVTGYGNEAGEPLVTHPDVAMVAFTGGDQTGQRVYELAAKGIKRVTLELGGKSANIVFADAPLDDAVNGVIAGIFAASGQTCIAGSRALVQRSIHDEFVRRLVDIASPARMGDPASPTTQIAPITTQAQHRKILDHIDFARTEGATIRLGGMPGRRAECGAGWFVEPTILTDVTPQMRIAREEVFGPVLSILPFDTDAQAIQLANDSPYGLAAGVWTQNFGRALLAATELQAGTVWVNTYRASSYMAPFGGYKRSGIGREGGTDAVYEFLQTKSIWFDTAGKTPNPFVMR